MDPADEKDEWIQRNEVEDLVDEELSANMCQCDKLMEPPDELVQGMCNECWQYNEDTAN